MVIDERRFNHGIQPTGANDLGESALEQTHIYKWTLSVSFLMCPCVSRVVKPEQRLVAAFGQGCSMMLTL
jgi:hypothetical protein